MIARFKMTRPPIILNVMLKSYILSIALPLWRRSVSSSEVTFSPRIGPDRRSRSSEVS